MDEIGDSCLPVPIDLRKADRLARLDGEFLPVIYQSIAP
jgi:hypothetical protein